MLRTRVTTTMCVAVACTASLFGAPSTAYACTAPGGGACQDSTLNVTLTAGTLALSLPGAGWISGTLGSASSFTTTMGTIQIQGGGLLTGWTLTAATSGDLTTGGASPQTIS